MDDRIPDEVLADAMNDYRKARIAQWVSPWDYALGWAMGVGIGEEALEGFADAVEALAGKVLEEIGEETIQ